MSEQQARSRRGHGHKWKVGATTVAAVLFAAAAAWSAQAPGNLARFAEPAALDTNVVTEFDVDHMTCPMCSITVRTAAKAVRGVVDARVSQKDHRAWVTYDPAQTTADSIAAAITKAGYPAKALP